MNWLNPIYENFLRAWSYATTGRTLAIVLGAGFALLAISLLIASRTKWGQTKPLTKCVVLSILAHFWLLMYALGSRPILPQGDLQGRDQNISVSFETGAVPFVPANVVAEAKEQSDSPSETPPWEMPVPLDLLPKPPELESAALSSMAVPDLLPLEPSPLPELPSPEALADLLHDKLPSPEAPAQEPISQDSEAAVPSLQPASPVAMETQPVLPPIGEQFVDDALAEVATPTDPAALQHLPPPQPVSSQRSPVLPPEVQLPTHTNLPREYALRQAPNRLQLSAAFGADADSEAAVEAGLKWLAAAQSTAGAWVAKDFEAGTETMALGEDRKGTGDRADTGISGLALLAFLSAGHTHLDGAYRVQVEHGLKFLIDAQMPSGDLSGPKQVGNSHSVLNARMYCHSIATLALAEAYGMTHDAALKPALLRAAQYSINAQDPRGGGWRYRPREPGDLSQFGWQAMALKSVERSGINIPQEVEMRMRGFLDSCAAGEAGGLATYRPRQGWPSETMTAEALACRLLMDFPTAAAAQREATTLIMQHRPGTAEDNVYFWYYATLALFQLQDENWRAWNQALKARLLETQIPAFGDAPGSWDPDGLWGGYGGRVYSTAMSCLCLEVYYRYLPMYQRANLARAQNDPTSR